MERNRNGNLPEELVHEILLRLPVKALLQCKCVCKEWCGLIASPSFVDRHFGHESNQDCLLFHLDSLDNIHQNPYAFAMYQDDERHSRVEESNHLPQMPTSLRVLAFLGPANGVFCAVSELGRVVLLNPAMREFKPLPPLPLHDTSLSPSMLAFGFGLDPSSGDYKVVAFQRWGKSPHFVSVYNLSSDSWKRIEAVDSLNSLLFAFESVCNPFLNGVYHWLMELVNHGGLTILAFDMRSENFQVIQVPDCLRFSERELRITAYGDSIAVLSYKVDECVDLWLMGRDGFWSKSFRIGPFQDKMWPLCVWKKNELLLETETSALIMCDISTQKVREVVPKLDPAYVCGVFFYKESLVSIKGEGEGEGDRADYVRDFFD